MFFFVNYKKQQPKKCDDLVSNKSENTKALENMIYNVCRNYF